MTAYTDPQGHTYIVDGDQVMISVYGVTSVVTLAEAREWWTTSARVARSYARPASVETGRRSLHGW